MLIRFSIATLVSFVFSTQFVNAQQGDPALTEVYSPVPPVVTPGKTNSDAPSDAIILFNGKNLDEWVLSKDTTKTATWKVADGIITVDKASGNIQTKKSFMDYQLHIEWRIPSNITGSGQARGNSGVFLASEGNGDGGYELQVLDNYNNSTYVNGQAGSIYKQAIPLANANKKPGEWQSYDVIWTAPRFNDDGSLKSPARVTVIFNGVLVQNNFELKGQTLYIGQPFYKAHGASPIKLQAHGDKSEPISYRNIWIRPL
ncbi:MAG: DUF1080 domain-containing protein [Bacteroidetes bacterium]|nr:DUF1080 domain-containing protein [Bacteroidota bacterium]